MQIISISLITLLMIGCFTLTPAVIGDMNPIMPTPDGNWTVDKYRDGNRILVSPISETEMNADFSEMNLTGSTGCNNYSAQYTSGSSALIITQLVRYHSLCHKDLILQEDAYIQDLKEAALIQRNDTSLLLFDGDEDLLVSYIMSDDNGIDRR
ncbi:MAG: META domain-containing protein [Methanobacteriota archaeon]